MGQKVYGAKPSTQSRDSSRVLTSIIAGMGAGVLWALIAYLTHYAFGWGAVGLGALVGLAVRKAAGQGNPSHGITAAALATGAPPSAPRSIFPSAHETLLRQVSRHAPVERPDAARWPGALV